MEDGKAFQSDAHFHLQRTTQNRSVLGFVFIGFATKRIDRCGCVRVCFDEMVVHRIVYPQTTEVIQ
jgi:hypothetical protein